MNNEHNPLYGAVIERGVVVSVSDDDYTHIIKSFDRDGVITPPMKSIDGTIYDADDRVFFFMFNDGSGRIIGQIDD